MLQVMMKVIPNPTFKLEFSCTLLFCCCFCHPCSLCKVVLVYLLFFVHLHSKKLSLDQLLLCVVSYKAVLIIMYFKVNLLL